MKVITTMILCLWVVTIHAQDQINESFSMNGIDEIVFDFEYADVEFIVSDGSELKIEGSVSINFDENNDSHRLQGQKEGRTFVLRSDIENEDELPQLITAYEDGKKVLLGKRKGGKVNSWKEIDVDGKYDQISVGADIEVKLVIYVPKDPSLKIDSKYGDLRLDGVSNEMEVENTYGHIEVIYQHSKIKPASLESTYDFVDVSIPEMSSVTVRMQSNYGELMTDMDIDVNKNESRSGNFKEIVVGNINGGGTEIQMKSPYDNVYLRKGQN